MDEKKYREIIENNRNFMRGYRGGDHYPSDQMKKLPQPPLTKAPMRGEEAKIKLPTDFTGLDRKADILDILYDRKSSRVYTDEEISLTTLSFLLWATQGVKEIRGRAYATLRPVPSAGGRHPYETYLIVRKVEGLTPGKYHYLPMEHALEYLGEVEELDKTMTASLNGQKWATAASVTFYWAMVGYRAEWRYSTGAHRPALIDVGHIGQNLYIACSAVKLGCCGIAAFDDTICTELFELDGKEEFTVYTMPVGTVREADKEAEQAFYAFVKEQNL